MVNKLKQARLDHKMTQMDVANKVGVSLFTYVLWERGGCKPNPENLAKLLKVLEIDRIKELRG